jgi:protein-S-isoprenylcysteine O-methyltransferase Ste14
MTMEDQKELITDSPDTKKNMFRRFLQVAFTLFLTAFLLFVSAGKLDWIYAWVFIAAYLLIIIVNSAIFPRELVSERGRKKKNVEKWDKVISGLIIIPMLSIFAVAGLDFRFGWTPERSLLSHLTGLVIFLAGIAIVSWSMVSNKWFSTAVRIQDDRYHSVADAGSYRYIRHPGYFGMIIYNLATPIILGSLWAFLPAVILAILFIIRTKLEDATLKSKLGGYKEYSEKVKYRLIPYIW